MKPFPNRWIRTVRFRWFAAVAVSVSSAHGIYAAEPDEPCQLGTVQLAYSYVADAEAVVRKAIKGDALKPVAHLLQVAADPDADILLIGGPPAALEVMRSAAAQFDDKNRVEFRRRRFIEKSTIYTKNDGAEERTDLGGAAGDLFAGQQYRCGCNLQTGGTHCVARVAIDSEDAGGVRADVLFNVELRDANDTIPAAATAQVRKRCYVKYGKPLILQRTDIGAGGESYFLEVTFQPPKLEGAED